MSKIRQLNEIDRINKLYEVHDVARRENILPFFAPPNPNILGLLDDVEALLSDPKTRDLTENTLRSALQHIAQQVVRTPR